MRRGFSPTKSKVLNEMSYRKEAEQIRRPISQSANYWKYFCHYNNAVYMGGMSAYKKHGRGIILHDEGAAAITEYQHDTPCGHTIIFRENSITSVLIKSSSEYEIAYKVGRTIIRIPFNDNLHVANGVGVLIDYDQQKIYQLIFKRGNLAQKILHLDRKNNEDVFRRNTITKIIGMKHEQAFELTFQKPQNMHVKLDKNILTIGYFDEYGQLHGLGFKMYAQNVKAGGQKSLYLKSLQRGYYRNSKLQTYGEKYFSNGNKYVGEFQKGQFHGHGILLCPTEMKWVYGKFTNGKLNDVIDSNNKRYTQNQFQVWNQSLRRIHKRYRERWIDLDIQFPDQLYLYKVLKEALIKPVTEIDPDFKEALKEDEQRLSRIQNQFQQGYPGNFETSYVDRELQKHYTVRSGKQSHISTPSSKGSRYDRQKIKNIITTPVNRIQDTRLQEPEYAENEYRMEDPFKIQLIKIPSQTNQKPIDREYLQKDQPRDRYDRYYENDPIRETPRSKYSSSNPYRYSSYLDDIQSRYRYYDPKDGVYRRNYIEDEVRQQQRLNRLTKDDDIYLDNLRAALSRSPVHRNYYSTPPKYTPERYSGMITNKRNFNYKDPEEFIVHKWPEPTSNRRIYPKGEDYDEDRKTLRRDSPTNMLRTSPVRRSSPRNLQSSGNKNFLQNNYKYWS